MADGARRRQRKGVVTRHLGTLDRLIAEEDVDGVRSRLESVIHSFADFKETHVSYHDTLVNEEDIQASDTWFSDMQTTYVAPVIAAKTWLRTQAARVDLPDIANPPAVTREDLLHYLHLPKVELDKFDGNPLEYLTFIAVFDEVVDNTVMDGQVKLTRLLQYTCGSAKAAIRNCALIGGEFGYNQARAIMHNRYGNAHLVSQRLISELKTGKRVVNADDLQQLADELAMAVTALEQLGKLSELNTQQSMIDILHRCQPYTRNRWRNKALESKRLNDDYPNLRDFAAFIQREASDACDPVYGLFHAKKCDDVKGVNYNTVTGNPDPVTSSGPRYRPTRTSDVVDRACVLCSQPHKLSQCGLFTGMQPRERFQVAKRHRLCFNCLLGGHISTTCYKQSMCTVPNCNRKHSELLHTDTVDDGNAVYDDIQVCNIATQREGASVYLPIVPVIVNGSSYPVYALLDSGSTNTFVTKQLVQKLKLQGKDVQYNMSTLGQSSEVKSTTVTFCLTSVQDDVKFDVMTALAVNSIPVRYPGSVIDIDQYPYLADLDLPRHSSDVRVDILIGMNNADALMPLEVKCSDKQKRHPYATGILFGWSLNGPVVNLTNSLQVSSHFVNLEQRISKLWEIEQCDEDSQSLSYDDRKVEDLWRREVKHEGGHYVVPIPWKDGRPSMPNNRAQAQGRLDNLIKQLHKGDHFGKDSDQIIKRQLLEEGHKVYVEYDDGGLAAFKEKRNDLEDIKKQADIPEREAKEQHEKDVQEAEARVQARLYNEQSETEFRRLDVNNDGLVSVTEMTGQLAFDVDLDGKVSPEEAKEYLEDNEAVNYETFHDKVWPNVKEILEKEREKTEGTKEPVKGDTDQPALPTPRPTITPPTAPVVFPTPPPLDREPPIEVREDLGEDDEEDTSEEEERFALRDNGDDEEEFDEEKEYLLELQRQQKWVKDEPNLTVGDLVLLLDENSPLGLVKDISVGRDGLVRSVRVKTATTEFVRPITKLVVLEGALYE